MSASLLDRLRELDGEATPGPWIARDELGGGKVLVGGQLGRLALGTASSRDAPLIAELRNALPAVVALVEAAQAFEVRSRAGFGATSTRTTALECLRDALAPFVGEATQ